jgi:signal transduction histidine kinase
VAFVLRRRSTLADVGLVVLLAAVGIVATHGARVPGVLVVGAAVPLVVRRRWPLLTLAATGTATVAYLLLRYPYGPILLSVAIAMYSVAASVPARPAAIAAAMLLGGLLVPALAGPVPPGWAWAVVPFTAGRVVRAGREAAAREKSDEIRRYVYEERLRIAREVHDVVGHGLAAISLQAQVALHVLERQPEQAEPALAAISRSSRESLAELRATLAVVGGTGGAGPGLAGLEGMVARLAGAGLAVRVRLTGVPDRLPAAVDSAVYRIVQEALTNVLRHAGTGEATVTVSGSEREVTVEVTDAGAGVSTVDGGQGITGMRSRALALGGDLRAGPRPGGGFRVYARLPVTVPS